MNMNKTLTLLVVLLASTFAFVPANAQHMSERKVEKVFKKLDLEVEGDEGVWMVNFSDRWVLVFADDAADRMRIFTPVVNRDEIGSEEWERMLEANFHTALDAKYGLYNEYVISVFSHPLSYLNEFQIMNALEQVVNLADTFGSSYASTSILFGKASATEDNNEELVAEGNLRINQRPGGGIEN
jgi:hypothetical protein